MWNGVPVRTNLLRRKMRESAIRLAELWYLRARLHVRADLLCRNLQVSAVRVWLLQWGLDRPDFDCAELWIVWSLLCSRPVMLRRDMPLRPIWLRLLRWRLDEPNDEPKLRYLRKNMPWWANLLEWNLHDRLRGRSFLRPSLHYLSGHRGG